MFNKKLCIGTAQFGMKYGISNNFGKTKKKELDKIFSIIDKKKIKFIDTALNYGNCEDILSKYNLRNISIITKIPKIPEKKLNIDKWIEKKIISSQKKLKIKNFYAILLHHPEDMLTKNAILVYNSLIKLKKKNKTKKIGISINNFDNCLIILKKFKFDIIQCPYNVIDRRLEKKKYINFFKKHKIEIHIRSIFLQGLLLMKKRPTQFYKWNKIFNVWDKLNKYDSLTAAINAINFVLRKKYINKIILGFDNSQQLKNVLINYKKKKINFSKKIQSNNLDLINPSNWK